MSTDRASAATGSRSVVVMGALSRKCQKVARTAGLLPDWGAKFSTAPLPVDLTSTVGRWKVDGYIRTKAVF